MSDPYDELKLSQPARRAFADAGYTQLSQFAGVSAQELLKLHGVGPSTIKQLAPALAQLGLSLAK